MLDVVANPLSCGHDLGSGLRDGLACTRAAAKGLSRVEARRTPCFAFEAHAPVWLVSVRARRSHSVCRSSLKLLSTATRSSSGAFLHPFCTSRARVTVSATAASEACASTDRPYAFTYSGRACAVQGALPAAGRTSAMCATVSPLKGLSTCSGRERTARRHKPARLTRRRASEAVMTCVLPRAGLHSQARSGARPRPSPPWVPEGPHNARRTRRRLHSDLPSGRRASTCTFVGRHDHTVRCRLKPPDAFQQPARLACGSPCPGQRRDACAGPRSARLPQKRIDACDGVCVRARGVGGRGGRARGGHVGTVGYGP
eukprot:scaffold2911_cov414-Prasinococcus_capsulatus_cf.AAC.16